MLRRIGFGIALLALVAAAAALVWREPLLRLHRVNTLFAEDRIVGNFSGMGAMFHTAPIPRSGPVRALPAAPRPLPERFAGPDGPLETAAFLERTATTSLLVLRAGAIEHEDYRLGTGPEDLRISWSVAKSVLATLIGIALDEGAIRSLDDPVTDYAPALKGSAYDGATLRHVLTMSSGVAFDEDYLDFWSDINRMGRELALGGSLDAFAAGLGERAGPPGAARRYVSIDTHVIGMVLAAATGRSVADFLAEKLWARIGAEADGIYLTDAHGSAFVLGGLNLRTRDYGRFGLMVLEGGAWDGARIAPADWVAAMTAPQAPPSAEPSDLGYGFQWWLPGGADGEAYAVGVYGQFVWIDRKAGVVIVKTSADRNFRADDDRSERESIAFFRAVARGG